MGGLTGTLATVGAGLVTIGASIGIGLIGSSAMAGIARQPEAAGKIRAHGGRTLCAHRVALQVGVVGPHHDARVVAFPFADPGE